MAITGQNEELSNMVMNIKPTHNNMWKDAIEGPCPPELKTEWRAVTQAGWGTQKN